MRQVSHPKVSHAAVQRQSLAAVGSLVAAQAAIGISALVRIPLITDHLGQGGYGGYFALGSLIPVLLVTSAGLRTSARAVFAEARGRGEEQRSNRALGTLHSLGRSAGFRQAVIVSPLLALLPLHSWLGAGEAVNSAEYVISVLITSLLCAAALPGSSAFGVLEAEGRAPLANALIVLSAMVGLAGTALISHWMPSFWAFCSVNVLSSTGPFFLARAIIRPRHSSTTQINGDANGQVSRTFRLTTARAIPPLASRTLDPFVIGAALGADSVAVYGLGSRLGLLSTIGAQGLGPVIAARMSHSRGAGGLVPRRRVVVIALMQSGLSAIVGTVVVVIGPWVASRLSGGTFYVGRHLFLAFAVVGVCFSYAETIAAAATTPKGVQVGWRIERASLAFNLVLSVVLVNLIGVVGPVWGSAVASGVSCLWWTCELWRSSESLAGSHLRDG